ncbi:hypothetical protein V1512DRAFT_211016 [Lipomyces arxii]|uniref:uncharacterized protein n=1 Tax=Lipomyces arxii TaxID=56418 RepID=UPI0034CE677C
MATKIKVETDGESGEASSTAPGAIENATLFVRSLPFTATSETLSDYFSNFCPVKHSVVVTDRETKESKGFGFVTFSLAEDAKKALEESRKQKFEGRTLQVVLAKKRERQTGETKSVVKSERSASAKENAVLTVDGEKVKRRPRLIIRNLPWSVRDPQVLVKLFSRYGKVIDAVIPRTTNGRMTGFAFVTLKKRTSADKAIKESVGLKIAGRDVAVDYAVEKDTWQKHVETGTDIKDGTEYSDEDDNSSDEDDDSDEDEDEPKVKKTPRPDTVEDTYTNSTVFVRNLSYQTDAESLAEHFEDNFGPVRYALPVIDKETGQPRGTGFVCFREQGAYETCVSSAPKQVSNASILILGNVDQRYVLDDRVLSVTSAVDRSRAGKLAQDGALKRQRAAGKDVAVSKDKRNLFLLNEGRIAPESELAKAMSKTDMDIRQQSLTTRRQQLRSNPSLHLSLMRLAVRNIPRSMTTVQLKLLARRAIVGFAEEIKEGKRQPLSKDEIERSNDYEIARGNKGRKKKHGVVKQVKLIVEDKKSGTGRSRGYGFIEFSNHRLALMGLRWLNAREIGPTDLVALEEAHTKSLAVDDAEDGKPKKKMTKADVIKDKEDLRKRRLVVEFAVENIEVVKRRQTREARFRDKVENAKLGIKKEAVAKESGIKETAVNATTAKPVVTKRNTMNRTTVKPTIAKRTDTKRINTKKTNRK